MLIPVLAFSQGTGTGLKGDYFKNTNLAGTVALTRTDGQVNFSWAQGSPANGIDPDKFSVRWTGQVEAPVTGAFEFLTRSDDGVRLWVNGKLLINHWSSHAPVFDQSVPMNLTAGQKYNIQLDYFENTGGATIQLFWRYPGQTDILIPKARLYPTAITPLPAPPVVSRRWLSDLNYLSVVNGWGPMEEDKSNGEQGARDGKTITIAGRRYSKGLGVHARSEVVYALNDQYDMFKAIIGVDDEVGDKGSVVFEVFGDGKSLFKSGVIRGSMPGQAIEVSVDKVILLKLVVTDAGDGIGFDHADWADARLEGIEKLRYLSDMRWDAATNGNGPVEKDKANGGTAANDGKRILLRGQEYRKGLGTHAESEIKYDLDGKFELFTSVLGIDDTANGQGSVIYEVWLDGKRAYRSALLRGNSPVQHIALPVSKVELLVLKVLDGGDGKTGDLADWADAKLHPVHDTPPPPTPVGAPAAPTNLTAAPGIQQVLLKWNAINNATSYNVYAGTTTNGQSNTPVASNLTKTEFTHAGLAAGVKMFYKVQAVNNAGAGNPSAEANATPTAPPVPLLPPPTTITLTAGNGQIVLNWGAVTGAVSYNLYRSTTSNGQGNTPVATNIRVLTFTDKPLNNGTRYFYKLATVNVTGVGAQSAEVNGVPLAPPVAPTNLTATAGNAQITLAWAAVAGATGYNVYRGTVANQQAATPIATNLSTPTFVNTGLTNGTTYFYKVTALNASGESPRSNEANAQPVAPQAPVDPATLSAFRATRQITWGPRPGDVERVRTIGRNAFLDEQFNQPMTTFPDSLYNEPTEVFQELLVRQFISAPDQLRLRVAWALSQIWVVSGVEIPRSDAMINYYRVLMTHAFGNYRDLMRDMTLNPAMGRYLNMLNNRSQAVTGQPPNENYSREICQLFTKGLVALNQDGSTNGTPGFTEADVANLARIFTGWTFGDGNATNPQPNNLTSENWRVPMEAVERFHDNQAKTFLGQNFVPGRTARQDLDQALDVIFNDPSVPPFVSRQLIQRLVTSNPSPAYISAVAGVFINNGAGVRGDLRAVVRAILTHPEASLGTNTSGKLMEPILFLVSQLRTLNATVADHPFITDNSTEMGQRVLYSPSVFNYYSPTYRIRGTTLFGPEFQIHTSVTTLARANFVGRLISGGFGGDVTIDYQPFTSRAANPGDLVDYIGLLFMGGNMSPEMRNEIVRAVSVTPASNTTERVRTALYLVLTAAQYQVER